MQKSIVFRLAGLGLAFAAACARAEAVPELPPGVQALLDQVAVVEEKDESEARALLRQAIAQMPPGPPRPRWQAKLCAGIAFENADEALAYADARVAELQAAGDRSGEARLQRCAGYAHEAAGDLAKALARYEAAVVVAEAGPDAGVLGDALASRGQMRHYAGDYAGALVDLPRAYELRRASVEAAASLPDTPGGRDARHEAAGGVRFVVNAMANLYGDRNVGDYDRAIGYYRELLAMDEQAGRKRAIATARYNLGATLDSKGDFAAALVEYQAALAAAQEPRDDESVAETQRAIASTLVKLGRAGEALALVEPALAYFVDANDEDGVNRLMLTRAVALRAAGRPVEALADLELVRLHFAAADNPRFLVRIDEERALAYAELGQWEPAYAALRAQFDTQRELDRRVAEDATARLRVQFDAERTEQKNLALSAENVARGAALDAATRERRLQQLVIVLGGLLLAVLTVLALRQLARSRRMRVLAFTDELTKLPNRRSILAFLDEQLRAAKRGGGAPAVVALDIDHFKRINDKLGHDAGDRALQRLATVVGKVLRGNDRLGRVGGEEFLLVLPATAVDAAADVGERVRQAVRAADFDVAAPGLRVTISAGVACADGGEDAATLLKVADEALYAAKGAGRDRVVVA
jgi:diguanylate cyclase (GGDEF)-like protein